MSSSRIPEFGKAAYHTMQLTNNNTEWCCLCRLNQIRSIQRNHFRVIGNKQMRLEFDSSRPMKAVRLQIRIIPIFNSVQYLNIFMSNGFAWTYCWIMQRIWLLFAYLLPLAPILVASWSVHEQLPRRKSNLPNNFQSVLFKSLSIYRISTRCARLYVWTVGGRNDKWKWDYHRMPVRY